MFTAPSGGPLFRSWARTALWPAVLRVGLDDIPCHGLRHSFVASWSPQGTAGRAARCKLARTLPAKTLPILHTSAGSHRRSADRQAGHVQAGGAVGIGDLDVERVHSGHESSGDSESVLDAVVVGNRARQ